jgi:AraC-like DNA-binding protein
MISDLILYTPMYVTLFWAFLLLITKRQNNRAKFFLGVFMVVAFFVYLSHAVYFLNQPSQYLYFDPVYTFASLSVYPLYYWYLKLLTIEPHFQRKNLLLLLPAFLVALLTGIIYLLMPESTRHNYISAFLFKKGELISSGTLVKMQQLVFVVGRLVFAAQVVVFLIFGSRLVVRYNQNIANFYSNIEKKTVEWAKLLLYSFVFTSAISFLFNILGRHIFMDSETLLLIPSTLFSVLLFIIGYQGNMQNYTIADLESDKKQYADLETKKVSQKRLKEELIQLFKTQHLHRHSDLKITQVAAELNTNRTYISNIINTDFSCSFSEFVNQYRIIEAKALLNDPTSKNYSLDYISEQVGFGSLHTFIRVFKESEGITPGRFRDAN